jgi:hypothetical protein
VLADIMQFVAASEVSWPLVGVALGVAGVAMLMALVRKLACQSRELNQLRSDIARFSREQKMAFTATYNMGCRMVQLESRLKVMTAVTAPLEPESPYTQASQLLADGADSHAVAAACGLSQAEAQLLQRMAQTPPSADAQLPPKRHTEPGESHAFRTGWRESA